MIYSSYDGHCSIDISRRVSHPPRCATYKGYPSCNIQICKFCANFQRSINQQWIHLRTAYLPPTMPTSTGSVGLLFTENIFVSACSLLTSPHIALLQIATIWLPENMITFCCLLYILYLSILPQMFGKKIFFWILGNLDISGKSMFYANLMIFEETTILWTI